MSEEQNNVDIGESQENPSEQINREQAEVQGTRSSSLDNSRPGLNKESGYDYADPNEGSRKDYYNKKSKRGRSEKRRKRKKRRRHRSPSSSDSDSSETSLSSTSSSPSPPPRKKHRVKSHQPVNIVERFEIIPKKDRNQWELSDDLAAYANSTKFIPDRDIFDNILENNPVPKNILETPKLDPFVISLLTNTHNSFEITRDKQMTRISNKLRDVYGPLSKVLHQMDAFKHSGETEMVFDHDQFSKALEQSVTLIGQTQGAINFQRRRSILGAITKSDNKAKSMITEEYVGELEDTESMLFGKQFQKKLEKRSKSDQKSIERLLSPQRQSYKHRQPFQAAPPISTSNGGGPKVGRFIRTDTRGGNNYRGKISSKTSLKHANLKVIKGTKTLRTPHNITNISKNIKSQSTFRRKTKIFSERVEENNFRSRNPEHNNRMGNTLTKDSLTDKTSNTNKNGTLQERISLKRGRQHVRERSYCKSKTRKGSVSEYHFPEGEKRTRNISPNHKLETTERKCPISKIQNGVPKRPEEPSEKRGFHGKDRSKRCIFYSSTQSKEIWKVRPVSMEWRPFRVRLSHVRARSLPADLHKITENPNNNPKEVEHQVDNLHRRHLDNGVIDVRNTHGQGYYTTPTRGIRVCDKLREVSIDPKNINRVFGGPHQQRNYDISNSKRENEEASQLVSTDTGFKDDNSQKPGTSDREAKGYSTSLYPGPPPVKASSKTAKISLQTNMSYETMITLKREARLELHWWIENISIYNGREITIINPEIVISSDASLIGWGAASQGRSTGGTWGKEEKSLHINVLELKAVDLAIRTFTKDKPVKAIHMQIDNTCALAYLINMGGTKNHQMTNIAKSIWSYLLGKGITCTAEYIPSELNVEADRESRAVDFSDWKLDPKIFQKICAHLGSPTVDLFASLLNHQISKYISWKPDPTSIATDAFQQNWSQMFPYAFPPFSLVGKTLKKVTLHCIDMIIITPVWVSQTWFPLLLQMSIQNPLLLPQIPNLLLNPGKENHPLVQNGTLHLAAWLVSGQECKQRAYQRGLPLLSLKLGEKAPEAITNQPGRNLVAGVIRDKLIQFDVL